MQQPTLHTIIDQWLEITIDRLHESLDDFNIGKLDGALWRSIVGEVVRSGEDPERVIVKFAQYGRFVDMGVGRGVPIGARGTEAFTKNRNDKGQLNRYSRKAKPWYSKTKHREVSRLRELLATNLADKAISEVESSLRAGLDINFNA